MALFSIEEIRQQLREEVRDALLEELRVEHDKAEARHAQHRAEEIGRLQLAQRLAERIIGEREQALAKDKGSSERSAAPHFLWSTARFIQDSDVASVERRLFQAPLQSVGQGFARPCSMAETNLRESNRLPAGTTLDVRAIDVELWGCEKDIALFRRIGTVCFDFLQTLLDLFPLGAPSWPYDQEP